MGTAEDPVISILMPSFNAMPHLPAALDSIFEQDFQQWELLVQDAQSSDGTLELLEAAASRAPGRIRIRSEPDTGQSDALNRALRRSRGTWVCWLNADDVLLPGALAAVAGAARTCDEDVGVIFGDWRILTAEGGVLRAYAVSEWSWNRFFKRGCYVFSGAWFIKRELLNATGGWREHLHYAMDLDLALRLGSPPAQHARAPLAALRWHEDAKTSNAMWASFRETVRVRRPWVRSPVRVIEFVRATMQLALATATVKLRFGKFWSRLRNRQMLGRRSPLAAKLDVHNRP